MGIFGSIGASAGSLTSAVGNGIGMMEANDYLNKAKQSYDTRAQQGIDTLQSGKSGAESAYRPYTQAGETGVEGLTSGITGRQQAEGPNLTDNTAQNAISNYLDPSAAYTTDQSNKAMQAAGIAGGGMGGGMNKALAANTAKLAMSNYNNAYNQMLQGNQQTFNQEQQEYTNNNDYQQQQIQNYAGLTNMGLGATGANQQLQAGYNQGINQDYQGMAEAGWNTNASKAANFNSGINNMAGNVGNSMAQGGEAVDSYAGMFGGMF